MGLAVPVRGAPGHRSRGSAPRTASTAAGTFASKSFRIGLPGGPVSVRSDPRATLPLTFNTLTVARQLAAGGVDRDQAEVIAQAIGDGLEHGDHVTSDQFKAGLAEVRTEIANLETRLVRWMVGTVIATAALTVGILRFLGD